MILIGWFSFTTGCGSVSREEVWKSTLRYHSVHQGIPKAWVLADLGSPNKITHSGAHWEVSHLRSGAWARLDVTFDEKDIVRRVEVKNSWPSYPDPKATSAGVYANDLDERWNREFGKTIEP